MTGLATIVVVAYNDAITLKACIDSLRSVADWPIIIVNNASNDATSAIARELAIRTAGVTAVDAPRNGGYAYGVNLARAHTDTPYLAVMNADCTATGDWLTPCIAAMEADPHIGACSPTVGLADSDHLNAEGLSIHKTGVGFNRNLGNAISSAATEPTQTPGLQGAAFLIRTAALDAVDGWYEGGFLYHEDVELSWVLRSVGYTTWHIPTPPLQHDYALTMSKEKFFLLERNRIEMLSVYLHPMTLVVMSPVLIAAEIAVWIYALRAGSGLGRAKLRSYRSVLSRRSARRQRRAQVRSFRTVSDRTLLAIMSWRYPRDQTAALKQTKPTAGRRGDRPMPTD